MFKGYTLGSLATVLGIVPVGPVETPVLRLTTDSRAVQPGDVFVALKGERFDAHQFLPAVAKQGAIAAVVEQVDPVQGSRFQLCYQGQSLGEIQLQLLGQHNIANALAAAAAAKALGIEQASIVAGLQSIRAVAGRMQRHQLAGITLIDDSYNANPVSMCAAIDLLSQAAGERILVLGDMGELGEWSQEGHAAVGRHASGRVDALYAVGQEIQAAVNAYQGPNAYFFASQAELLAHLLPQLSGEKTILVKGSRSAAMDHVVQACLANVQEIH
ncbi:glutamate ligase domain-containing protein [Thiopseudomonas alkaliphila]|uniref:glutamate ligase domain-containing protein n=1 Tax=Thiopseudomonas alkaliphila TaxID=1697053 RepID=UPI00069F3CCD|nr:cyanophycin synthetase [Thiopseudomonas alkaliphila]